MNDRWRQFLRSFLRYGAGSLTVLLCKLLLTFALMQFFRALIAYLMVHFAVFFISYLIHSYWSFQVSCTKATLLKYFQTVAVFKLADYLVFSIAFSFFKIEALWSVLLATILIALVRFLSVKKALEEPQGNSSGTL